MRKKRVDRFRAELPLKSRKLVGERQLLNRIKPLPTSRIAPKMNRKQTRGRAPVVPSEHERPPVPKLGQQLRYVVLDLSEESLCTRSHTGMVTPEVVPVGDLLWSATASDEIRRGDYTHLPGLVRPLREDTARQHMVGAIGHYLSIGADAARTA